MAGDMSMRYTLDYQIAYDIDAAKESLTEDWDDSDDEEEFIEFLQDHIISSLEEYEYLKASGLDLPPYITHFSLVERR